MALLKYFKVVPGRDLPNPDGPLSALIPPKAIEAANSAVEEMREESQVKKRGPYIKMSNEVSWFSPTLQLLSYSSSPNSFVFVIATNASLSLEIVHLCFNRGKNFVFNAHV